MYKCCLNEKSAIVQSMEYEKAAMYVTLCNELELVQHGQL